MKKYKNIDVIRYLNDKGVTCAVSGKNVKRGEVNTTCPFCDDRSNHLRIKPNNFLECWKCGDHGFFVNLIKILDNCQYKEALKILKTYETSQPLILPQQDEWIERDIDSFKFPFGFKQPIHKPHREYLIDRNFDPDELQFKYNLKSCLGENSNWRYRLIFPIFLNGKIVNFVGRTILENEEIRYKDSKDEWVIPKRELVYNIDNVKENGVIVIVEGLLDACRLQHSTIATMSTNFTVQQIDLIRSKKPKKIFICFDNPEFDPNAEKKAEELANYLYFTDVEFIDLPSGIKDVGELGEDDVRHLRAMIF